MLYSNSVSSRGIATPRHLPAALISARAEVFNPLACLDLNLNARRVLFGILTFLNLKKIETAIFPKRETLRAEALVNSDATLYRGLALLEQKGYIERQQIRKAWNGKFHLSPITLTEKCRAILALGEFIHSHPSTNMRDGYVNKEHTNNKQSLQNTTDEADSVEKPSRRNQGLPEDLATLMKKGVKKSAICWLMKQASLKSKRLSDIVKIVHTNIQHLSGREIVAYLKAMIKKDLDYAWIAKETTDRQVLKSTEEQLEAIVERLDHRYHGNAVYKADGTIVGYFEAMSDGQHMICTGQGATPVNKRFAGALVAKKLRLENFSAEFLNSYPPIPLPSR